MPNRCAPVSNEGSLPAGATTKLEFLASPEGVFEVMTLREHEAKEKMWVRMISSCSLLEELQRRAIEAQTKKRWRIVLSRNCCTTQEINHRDFIFGQLQEDGPPEHGSASGSTTAGSPNQAPTEPSSAPSLGKDEEGLEKTKSDCASEGK